MITITLKDGSTREFDGPISIYDIATSISPQLAKKATAGLVNDELTDLRTIISENIHLSILTFDDEMGKLPYRHTVSHILAQAVKRLHPSTKLAIGPAIEDGFYYDFDKESGSFSKEELLEIEKEMQKIIKEALPIEKFELSRAEALKLMTEQNEIYKVELINDLPEDAVLTFYKQGEFTDLCAGPHVMNTKEIKAIKLYSEKGSSGAYWKGSEKNKMLSRVYGTAFNKASDLTDYLAAKEEAEARDHNKLGRELKYFTSVGMIGQGLPLFMPKGAKVLQLLQRFVEDEEEKRGYSLTKTPFMAKKDLYKMSGHWQKYRDGMFYVSNAVEELETKEDKDPDVLVREEDIMALRPMTCPFQFMIYNADAHSYRDLPIRYGETSTLFRNESSGEMHGIIRNRQFVISEGHIICREDQVKDEFNAALDLVNFIMNTLGIDGDVSYTLSTYDPNNTTKFLDNPAMWEKSQTLLAEIMDEAGLTYTEDMGGDAFYGPKLDVDFKNVFGKKDTIITIQLDFLLSDVFDMSYTDSEGNKTRPVIIHRTSIGCYERTLAMLIEKYAGAMPTWLAPTQVSVLPLSEKYADYADKVTNALKARGIRVFTDHRAEKLGYKIREARLERSPYIAIIGEEEEKFSTVSLRSREFGEEGSISLEAFVDRVIEDITTRSLGAVKPQNQENK